MTQEDKELLLRDLCARLPYENIIGKCELDASYDTSFDTIFQTHKFDAIIYGIKEGLLFVYPLIEDRDEQEFANEEVFNGIDILDFKPYLFPLSSMTEKQKKEFDQLIELELKAINDEIDHTHATAFEVDFYNKYHFDWRGLIEKGLAIDATNLNIYDKEYNYRQ